MRAAGYTDRTFWAPTAEEAGVIAQAIEAIRSRLPFEVDTSIPVAIHEGISNGGTCYGAVGAIGINAKALLNPMQGVDSSVQARVERILAHEYGHLDDRRIGYSSESTAVLQEGGRVYTEAQQAIAGSEVLAKWFGYIVGPESKLSPERRARELYAQLVSLYVTQPELMREYFPKAFRYFEARNQALGDQAQEADSGRTDAVESVPDGAGNPGDPEAATADGDRQVGSRRSGVVEIEGKTAAIGR